MNDNRPIGRIFAKVDVEFFSNPKVLQVARDYRSIALQMILFSKRTLSDGKFTELQMRRECWDYSRDELIDAAAELVAGGLWEQNGSGFEIVGWLDRNKSAAAIRQEQDEKTRRASRNAHKSHHPKHVRDKVKNPECELCFPSSLQTRTATHHTPAVGTQCSETESESETETETQLVTTRSSNQKGASPSVSKQSQPQPTFDPDLQGLRTAIAHGVLNPAGGPRLDDYTHTISPRGITAARTCFPHLQAARPEQIRTIYHAAWTTTLTPTTNGTTP